MPNDELRTLPGIQRGDFVVLKRYLKKDGSISPRARLGSVRNANHRGTEVMWTNKSDKKLSHKFLTHKNNSLHKIDRNSAVKVVQLLHKHIATKVEPPSKQTPAQGTSPPSVEEPSTTS